MLFVISSSFILITVFKYFIVKLIRKMLKVLQFFFKKNTYILMWQ